MAYDSGDWLVSVTGGVISAPSRKRYTMPMELSKP